MQPRGWKRNKQQQETSQQQQAGRSVMFSFIFCIILYRTVNVVFCFENSLEPNAFSAGTTTDIALIKI
jgi:hypothetical protein